MAKTQDSPTQVVRAVRLLQRLQGRQLGLRLDDLASELNVSRSQVRRDLLALEEAGIRLAFDKEEGRYGRARVRILDADTTRVPITRRERYTLLAVRRLFDVFRGTPLFEDIESIYEKLVETLPHRERKDLQTLASQVVYLPSGGVKKFEGSQEIIDALQTGVMMRRLISYQYKPRFGPTSAGSMEPYAFVLFRNGLYVVASRILEGDERQEPRVFAVERFLEADTIRGTRFEPPEDLDVESLFDGAFGIIRGKKTHHVVVELSQAARADALTRQWHKTQVTKELPGGRVQVEFDVTSLGEVASWILEWGPKAVAIAPGSLRRKLSESLVTMAEQYG